MDEHQISNEFFSLLRQDGEIRGFTCQFGYGSSRRLSRKIIELSGSINCLLYFKVRSSEPYRRGVTANRINELNQSGKRWYLVLLYESAQSGYLLTSEEVSRYLSIWALGRDGDYKVGPGSYLQFNQPFHSFSEFLMSLAQKTT